MIKESSNPNIVAVPDDREGRTQAAGLLNLFHRHPVMSAVVITLVDIVIALAVGLAVTPLVPPFPRLPDLIALCVLIVATVLLITFLGWWRVVGLNRPAEWRDLKLLLLPTLLMLLPLLGGFKAIDAGTVVYLLAGYLLTGFFEETMFRGLILRVLRPKGIWFAVLVSSLLFGLAHSTNLFLHFSGQPMLVGFQMIGVFAFGVGFAAFRLRTNTLWPLILLHAGMDFFLALGQLPTLLVNPIQDVILLLYGLFLLRGMRREEPGTSTPIAAAPEQMPSSQQQ